MYATLNQSQTLYTRDGFYLRSSRLMAIGRYTLDDSKVDLMQIAARIVIDVDADLTLRGIDTPNRNVYALGCGDGIMVIRDIYLGTHHQVDQE